MKTGSLAPGSDSEVFPRGTSIEKCNSVPGKDTHRDGAKGCVLEVLGPRIVDGERMLGYFVEWEDLPGVPVFVAGDRVRRPGS